MWARTHKHFENSQQATQSIQTLRSVGPAVEYKCSATGVVTPLFTGDHVRHIMQSAT